jgi:hypothetical protein
MTDEKALTTTGKTVTVYGESGDVAALQQRIMTMLPQVAKIGPQAAYGLAQVSLAMGLNPFIGEIWAIPSKSGGYAISGGIKGMRRSAHKKAEEDGGMYTTEFRRPTDDEIEGLTVNQGDIVRACDVYVSGRRAEAFRKLTGKIPMYTGIGVYRKGESTRMNPLQCVRKRAEADGLKQAFDLPLAFSENHDDVDFIEPDVYDADYVPDGSDTTAPIAVDEVFGEYEHDGDHDIPGEKAPRDMAAPAWVTNPSETKRFYIWLNNQQLPNGKIITKGQMYEAIGVQSSLKEYTGTIGEAKQAVLDFVANWTPESKD